MDLEHDRAARPKHGPSSLSRRCSQEIALTPRRTAAHQRHQQQKRPESATQNSGNAKPAQLHSAPFHRPNMTPAANDEPATPANAIPGNCPHYIMICRRSTAGCRIAPDICHRHRAAGGSHYGNYAAAWRKKRPLKRSFPDRGPEHRAWQPVCNKRQPTIDCLRAFKRDSSAAGTLGLRLANSSSCEASSSAQSSLEKEVTVWNCCAVKLPRPFHSMSA